MGLFSSKTIVSVASSVYNLAGDRDDRPNYAAMSVIGTVLDPKGRKKFVGRELVQAHLRGPSIKQRQFSRWALENFPIGVPTAEIVGGKNINTFDFKPYLGSDLEAVVTVNSQALEGADFFVWAEKHILETRPADIGTDWLADYDRASGALVIQYADFSTESVPVPTFDSDERYIYVRYTEAVEVVVPPPDPLPDPPPPEETETVTTSKIFIYQIGSGTVELDVLDETAGSLAEFMPFIPLRLDNKAIDDPTYDEIFGDCAKAYKKLTGKPIEDILTQIADNENIGDVDHCYLQFGVPLNTMDNDSRLYLYEFFKMLTAYQQWSELDYTAWQTGKNASGLEGFTPVTNQIRLKSNAEVTASYDIRLNWITISESIQPGLGKPTAKVGDCWFGEITEEEFYDPGTTNRNSFDNTYIYHQTSQTSFRRLTLRGLLFQNFIYGGNAVSIRPQEALDDPEENGFTIPIHYPTLRKVSLKSSTQMAVGNTLLVFNSYQVTKQKWYQRGFFRILLMIAIAVIGAFVFPGAIGLLGSNLAVGTTLGFSGTSALIAGAVVNALAAVALTTVIQMGSTALFGEKLGAIIGAIATFIAFQSIMQFQTTGSWNIDWGQMMRVDNLMKMTDSVAGAVRGLAQAEIGDIREEFAGLTEWYGSETDKIENLTRELLGYSGVTINPLMLTEIMETPFPRAESMDSFLQRTMLNGSDIAEVSFSMIEDFADISLQLPKFNT